MKAVQILSGGMDSVTLLYKLLKEGRVVHALSFNYGQRHSRELEKARDICSKNQVPWTLIDLSDVNKILKGSALSDKVEVPEGHYAEDNMKATVVPSRNTFMLAIASAYAVAHGIEDVYYGAHAGDHAQYMDCRQEYLDALNKVMAIANFSPVKIHAPFIGMDKGDIAKLGLELGVPYEETHTCYKGEAIPCMRCGACVERCEAFQKANVRDPLLSEAEWEKAKEIHRDYKTEYEASKA